MGATATRLGSDGTDGSYLSVAERSFGSYAATLSRYDREAPLICPSTARLDVANLV